MSHAVELGDSFESHVDAFRQAIEDCLELYRSSAEAWSHELLSKPAANPVDALGLMDDLARGLLIKIFLAIVQADRRFSAQERELAQVLLFKLWGRTFLHDEIGSVLRELIPLADQFDWYQLVRPFADVPLLAERVVEVETIVMRFGNLVAKADGTITAEESARLNGLLAEIDRHLRPVPVDEIDGPSAALPHCDEIRRALNAAPRVEPAGAAASPRVPPPPPRQTPTDDERLHSALKSLDELIGLEGIKNEVRELTRFLQVQRERERAGLPRTQVSLHTVFAGNPDTGKTSVARVLGEVLGALGIVSHGHLVEADRSTLVAGYVGQTAERTNHVIDQALDGVLFIDEAYSLVNDQGDDPYGQEAMQILLKRMEDNRDRLVVVLAGYPHEMQRLLASNPGLASRFQRTFDFPDYTAVELCHIFQALCEKNHYALPAATRARLILGCVELLKRRDERFGNGRLMRNLFEQAIRRLANRIADIAPLTKELLTRLEPSDILFAKVPERAIDEAAIGKLTVTIICPGCKQTSRLAAEHLGRRAQCNKCHQQFTADWGEPVET